MGEQVDGPGSRLGNLACWRYCVNGGSQSWFSDEEVHVDENPDEVIRVRAKGMVPNNYQDDHFDLREPNQILGKTLCYLNRDRDNLSRSLNTLGLVLWGKNDQVMSGGKFVMVEEVGEQILKVSTHEKQLVEQQTKLYKEWSLSRDSQLDKEYQMLVRRSRMEAIAQTKEELAREEEKLFFFDNFDKLEQEKEEKLQDWRKTFPRRNWGQKGYFNKGRYLKKTGPGQERKEARWEKREAKMGPPK